MTFSQIEALIDRYDTATSTLDQAVTDRISASMDASFRQMIRELERQYPTWQSQGSLFASQRRLLLLNELGPLLAIVRPEDAAEYERLMAEALQLSHTTGATLADELVRVRDPGYPLQDFATIPIEAAVAQARDGVGRLSRYSDEFRTAASGIVEQGLIQGLGTKRVQGVLERELGVAKSKAETLARTEIHSALTTASEERYQRAGVEWVQVFLSPSESNCPFCVARNGNIYEVGQIAVPQHPRCRCFIAPAKRSWLERGLTDNEAVAKARTDAIAAFEGQGGRLNYGVTSWEKKAGLTTAPAPVWKPGDAVVAVPVARAAAAVAERAGALPLHEQLISKGKQTFANEVESLSAAYASIPDQKAIGKARRALGRMELQYLKAADSGDVFKADTLAMQLITANENLRNLENRQNIAVQDAFRGLKSAIGQGVDLSASRANAGNVGIPRKSKNNPYEKGEYTSILNDLYAATNNQVTTLERLYYKKPRAFAAKPGVSYRGELSDMTGRINVGKSSSLAYHTQTLWHEYGHHLEFSNPQYAEAARLWIKSKATSDTTQKLKTLVPGSNYENWEVAYPDKFINPYVGKYYRDGSTEVVSMGLEHFASPALMRKLYEADPDHFFLILGMLR